MLTTENTDVAELVVQFEVEALDLRERAGQCAGTRESDLATGAHLALTSAIQRLRALRGTDAQRSA